jgi:hypothetical protein
LLARAPDELLTAVLADQLLVLEVHAPTFSHVARPTSNVSWRAIGSVSLRRACRKAAITSVPGDLFPRCGSCETPPFCSSRVSVESTGAMRSASTEFGVDFRLPAHENPSQQLGFRSGERRVWHRALRDWPSGRVTARLRFITVRVSRCSGGICSCSAAVPAAVRSAAL